MNENLKAIYEASLTRTTTTDHAGNPLHVVKQNPELFALRVLLEALAQVDAAIADLDKDGEVQQSLGAEWAGYAIVKHFGIKE